MGRVQFSDDVKTRHEAIVQRAMPIANAMFADAGLVVRDEMDRAAPVPRARTISLERAQKAAIVREGAAHTRITYIDPNAEDTLAMVIAAMAGPRDPIAADPESLSILALADRLAASDIPVLIGGPTGTGKEVLSRFIHDRSDRADGPFVAVNCAALPEAMLEAMLFGHQKGAFTGAMQANEGFMRAAEGGTLLLDEIAEMPLPLQAKLLRALQEREVVPLGSTTPIAIDTRVIACANRDLPLEVAEGRFRADLYYRLNVFPLSLRPLFERPEDIAPLAFALALRHASDARTASVFSAAALDLLKRHSWPGNVRELENVVRRAILLAGDASTIEAGHIVFDDSVRLVSANADTDPNATLPRAEKAGARKLSSIVRDSEAQAILETLETCGGSRIKAARALGISERTLRYRLASFREAGIEIDRAVAGGVR